jgi:PAS domain S-box-containing protein
MTLLTANENIGADPQDQANQVGKGDQPTAVPLLRLLMPRSLLARITLLFSMVVSLVLLAIALHIVQRETASAEKELLERVRVLAQTMSASVGTRATHDDYATLQDQLEHLAKLKEISRLTITDPGGTILADVTGDAGGNAEPSPRVSKLTPPETPIPNISIGGAFGTAWYPILDIGHRGWLSMDFSLDMVQAARKRIWREVTVTGAIALIVILTTLMMVLWRPVQVIGRVTEFADRLRDSKGEQMDVVICSREITNLQSALNRASRQIHQQQQNLSRTAQRMMAFLDTAADAVITIDEHGLITSFNRAAETSFGYSASEAIGHNVSMLVPEPDRSRHDGYIANYLKTRERKVIGSGRELDALRRDGSTFRAELSVSEIRSEGHTYFLGLIRDISDRKQAENLSARLGRILEESSNEIYVFDAKAQYFLQANRGARENLGYSMEELKRLRPHDIICETDMERFESQFPSLQKSPEKDILFETTHRRKDGSTYPVEARLQLFENEIPPVYVAIVQDVTRRKLAEQEFRQAQKMESIGHLTSGVAHEFNNMLNAVGGFAHLIKREADNPDLVREWIDEVISASDQASSLTSQLLSFSRKHPLKERVLVAGDFVTGLRKLLGSVVEKAVEAGRQIDLDFNVTDHETKIKTDPSQLSQALLNLAINARDAMPDGGRIQMGAQLVDVDQDLADRCQGARPGPYAMIYVKDTGYGIDADTLARIFDPFFTTKEDGQGTGLGLSMVHGMVHQSGGFLDVESQVGAGTTVKIYLPAVDEDATPEEEEITGY